MIKGMTSEDTRKAWQWRQYAILAVGAAILGLLWWQLSTLNPKQWCQTAYDFAKTDNIQGVLDALKTCVGLQEKILAIKDHTIIGLIVAVFMTQLLFLVSEFGMKAKGTGPAGMGFDVGKDDTHHIKGTVEGTVTDLESNPSK